MKKINEKWICILGRCLCAFLFLHGLCLGWICFYNKPNFIAHIYHATARTIFTKVKGSPDRPAPWNSSLEQSIDSW